MDLAAILAAHEAEQKRRDEDFLPRRITICGFRVEPVSPLTWRYLTRSKSGFLGGDPGKGDLVNYIFYHNLRARDAFLAEKKHLIVLRKWPFFSYSVDNWKYAIWLRVESLSANELLEAYKSVSEEIHRAFVDGPHEDPDEEDDGKSVDVSALLDTSALAILVDLFASRNGWTKEYICNFPMGALWQLWRRERFSALPKKDYEALIADRTKWDAYTSVIVAERRRLGLDDRPKGKVRT
jgi:hypothetical protein